MNNAELRALAGELGISEDKALSMLVKLGREHHGALAKQCGTYRNRRKYTLPKLTEFNTDEGAVQVRRTIESDLQGPLLLSELIAFLKLQESVLPEWKLKKLPPADGVPRKRGRPRKSPVPVR